MSERRQVAPGIDPVPRGELPWYREAIANGSGYLIGSVVFFAMPFAFGMDLAGWRGIAIIVLTIAAALCYLGTTLAVAWGEIARWLWLLGEMGCLTLIGVLSDGESRPAYFFPFVAAMAAMLFEFRVSRVLVVALAVPLGGWMAAVGDLFGLGMVTMGFVLGLGLGASFANERTQLRLREAEERTAVFAVAAERERIAQDLHDILGHSLTTIAVKADLAERLIAIGDPHAGQQVGELATIARAALADVRATASGMREVRLASEIASVRSVLDAAGIEPVTPSGLPTLDDRTSELFGYVVREAVTNVIRHSGATRCEIEADESAVSVIDDGHGIQQRGAGHGLANLRQRVESAGGVLEVSTGASGTKVRAELGEQK